MPETVGIYYRDDEVDELEAFDEVAYRHQEGRSYSRSEAVRDAMDMYRAILETMEDIGWSDMPEPQRRSAVKQALRDADRREKS